MRKYLIAILYFISSHAVLGQVQFVQDINSYALGSGAANFYSGQIIAPTSPSTSDYVFGSSSVTFTGGQEVDLLPGFTAGNYTSGGMFHALIGPINATILSNAPYYKYQKFEIGLQLAPNFQPLTYINNYMCSERTLTSPIVNCGPSLSNFGTLLNPFDPTQVLVTAVFTAPSGKQYTRYGFYYQEITIDADSMEYAPSESTALASPANPYPFRIRFAPTEPGNWTVSITFYDNINGTAQTIGPMLGSFTVTDDSDPGFVKVGTSNSRYLTFSNGTSFFPVGQDIPYPDEKMGGMAPGVMTYNIGDYCYGCGTPPLMYGRHQQWIKNAGNEGADYVRVWPFHSSYDFEFRGPTSNDNLSTTDFNTGCPNGKSANQYQTEYPAPPYKLQPGYYEQLQAWELDKVLNISEQNGVYLLFELLNEGVFNSLASLLNAQSYSWDFGNSAYYNYLHANYSSDGEGKLVEDFFTDPCTIQFFKNRLFYIMARWGYSTHIGTWELLNETEQIGGMEPGQPDVYMDVTDYPNMQSEVGSWVTTMQNYIKSLEPQSTYTHLFTNGYGAGPGTLGDNSWSRDNSAMNYDLLESHSYSGGWDDPINQFHFRISWYGGHWFITNYSPLYTSATKPFIFGEEGHGNGDIDFCTDYGFHGSSWSSAFMSSAAGLYWWDDEDFDNVDHRANFGPLRAFFDQIDFQNSDYDFTQTQYRSYLSSGTQVLEQYWLNNTISTTQQIGWIHNNTVNFGSYASDYSGCNGDGHCSLGFDGDTGKYASSTTAVTNPTLTFNGLTANTYYTIYFFNTYNKQTLTQTGILSDGSGFITTNGVDFAATTPSYTSSLFDNSPDYAYWIYPCTTCRIRKSNSTDSTIRTPISAEVYPNPANSNLTIETQPIKGQIQSFHLYNSLGQQVRYINLTNTITTLPIQDLSAGFYFYRITDQQGNIIKIDKITLFH